MMQKPLRVIYKLPGCDPYLLYVVDQSLETLHALVGGHIEIVRLTPDLAIVVNEEGLLDGLPPNLRTNTGALLVGALAFVRRDLDGADDFTDTIDEDLAFVKRFCKDSSIVGTFHYDLTGALQMRKFGEPPQPPKTIPVEYVKTER